MKERGGRSSELAKPDGGGPSGSPLWKSRSVYTTVGRLGEELTTGSCENEMSTWLPRVGTTFRVASQLSSAQSAGDVERELGVLNLRRGRKHGGATRIADRRNIRGLRRRYDEPDDEKRRHGQDRSQELAPHERR